MDWQTVLGWNHATGIMDVTAFGSDRTSTLLSSTLEPIAGLPMGHPHPNRQHNGNPDGQCDQHRVNGRSLGRIGNTTQVGAFILVFSLHRSLPFDDGSLRAWER